mgnify:FL=1
MHIVKSVRQTRLLLAKKNLGTVRPEQGVQAVYVAGTHKFHRDF